MNIGVRESKIIFLILTTTSSPSGGSERKRGVAGKFFLSR